MDPFVILIAIIAVLIISYILSRPFIQADSEGSNDTQANKDEVDDRASTR